MALDARAIGERIAAARRARGISQQALAQDLGVSRPALAALEAGRRRLKAEELYRLAEILEKPMGHFVRSRVAEVDFQPLFRLFTEEDGSRVAEDQVAYGASRDSAVRQLERFRDHCARWVEALGIAGAEPPQVPQPPRRGPREEVPAVAAADWARDRLGLDDRAPLLGLRDRAEAELGIQVFVLDDDGSDLSGASLHDAAAGACLLVVHGHPGHMRFTLAHELAHLLVHRGQAHALGHDRVRSQEVYANRFAAQLLMPASGVRERAAEAGPLEEPGEVLRLARRFEVSFSAMAVRLESLRMLPRAWLKALREGDDSGSAPRVGRDDDAGGIPVWCRRNEDWSTLPARFRDLALELAERGEVTSGKLAEWLDVDLDAADRALRGYRAERGWAGEERA